MMDKEKVDEKNAILEIADNDLADATGGSGGFIKSVVQIINEVAEKTPVSSNPTLVSSRITQDIGRIHKILMPDRW